MAGEWNSGGPEALKRAVDSFDLPQVVDLCDRLVHHVRRNDELVPVTEAKSVLDALRRKRHFGLMQRVADALIISGQKAPVVRRQLAQSLLDQGNISASLHVLERLAADTAGDQRENVEARGLIGRAYKQMYVDSGGRESKIAQGALQHAVDAYWSVYKENPRENHWHGINTVAMVQRGSRDGLDTKGMPDPDALAREILEAIERKEAAKTIATWDYASAAEACVALNRPLDAFNWLAKYITNAGPDAFELASLNRQLSEVWQIDGKGEIGRLLFPFLHAELLSRKGGILEARSPELVDGSDKLLGQFERLLGADGIKTLKWFVTGIERCERVARIGREATKGEGTGFVLCGGELHSSFGEEPVLLTNAHVLSDPRASRDALLPEEAVVTFQAGTSPEAEFRVKKVLWSSPPQELDATLAQLDRPIPTKSLSFPISKTLPLNDGKQRVYIIGHPGGGTLSLSLQDNFLLDHEPPRIHYRTPTEGGSSGSPVFNADWRLIGIHHYGSRSIRCLNGQPGMYEANEGIAIQSIRDELAKRFAAGTGATAAGETR